MAGAAAVDVPAPAATNGGACCHAGAKGPGYATPLEAMEKGPREKLIYVTCVYNGELASCITPYGPYRRPATSYERKDHAHTAHGHI